MLAVLLLIAVSIPSLFAQTVSIHYPDGYPPFFDLKAKPPAVYVATGDSSAGWPKSCTCSPTEYGCVADGIIQSCAATAKVWLTNAGKEQRINHRQTRVSPGDYNVRVVPWYLPKVRRSLDVPAGSVIAKCLDSQGFTTGFKYESNPAIGKVNLELDAIYQGVRGSSVRRNGDLRKQFSVPLSWKAEPGKRYMIRSRWELELEFTDGVCEKLKPVFRAWIEAIP